MSATKIDDVGPPELPDVREVIEQRDEARAGLKRLRRVLERYADRYAWVRNLLLDGPDDEAPVCDRCSGSGETYGERRCSHCNGRGYEEVRP